MSRYFHKTKSIGYFFNQVRVLGPLVLILFLGLIACNKKDASNDKNQPEGNRFTKVVLAEGFDEPMAMTFLPDGKVLIVERKGALKSFDTKTNELKRIATIPVNTKYVSKEGVESEAEEGLMGIVSHPDYERNHWIYMYYADPTDNKHVLARWVLKNDSLITSTKKTILEIPTQREVCCHTGGGMVFDQQGDLFLTVGNNTANPANGTSSYDERPGRESWDDQRSSGNSNDLRGKILRIHPREDGTYTIPDGNLFAKGTPQTRPEIFVMGNRNPWRISLDSKTGWVYWGEVGPDASVDSTWGARGYDEFNQARKPGYFGWPYFIGDNKAYVKYNYADSTYGEKFNSEHPVNNSPNNTGIKDLPPAQKPLIWYPYATSDSFPLVGSSGRSATGGPIFRKNDFKNAKRPWPAYFEGKWLITDFMRGWVMAVTMDENGNYQSMERILKDIDINSAIDLQFSPEGDLYVLEYGSAWFTGNANSTLKRIEYNAGNRKPVVEVTADKEAGGLPFVVQLSSKGTIDYDDYDKDALKYEWKISGNGLNKIYSEPNPTVTFDNPGSYQATLTVTDTKGEKNTRSINLVAGNEPPVVSIDILKGNNTFFFPNETIQYAISVKDKEDGNTSQGKIKPDAVAVNFDYVPEGFDPIAIAQNHRAADERVGFSAGRYLINSSDCNSCHVIDKKSVGPSYLEISIKYQTDKTALSRLAQKVINGGGGVWGEHAMSAHPSISKKDAETMVSYILNVNKKSTGKPLPLSGNYTTRVTKGENGKGGFLIRAAYTDKGASGVAPLSSEKIIALRNPVISPDKAELKNGDQLQTTPLVKTSMIGNKSFLGFRNIDLTGIGGVKFLVQVTPNSGAVGGVIEIHIDGPDGELIGKTDIIAPNVVNMVKAREEDEKKVKKETENIAAKTTKNSPQTSAGFNPERLRKLISVQSQASLLPVTGMHDVYFLFRNDNATKDQIVMHVFEVEFSRGRGN